MGLSYTAVASYREEEVFPSILKATDSAEKVGGGEEAHEYLHTCTQCARRRTRREREGTRGGESLETVLRVTLNI